MSKNTLALAIAAALLAGAGSLSAAQSDAMTVLGSVKTAARPVEQALVVAFNIADFSTHQTVTARDGVFRLPPLKSGVYRVIAVKDGFAPAVATVLPSRKGRNVSLNIRLSKELTSTAREQIWQIRRSLPSDVLRELDHVMESDDAYRGSRLQGEMSSVASFGGDGSAASVAQTDVGLRGEFGDGWRVDVKGRMEKGGDDVEVLRLGEGEGHGVVMEIQSSPGHGYRVASSKTSWGLQDGAVAAALESHQVEWRNRDTRLSLRYFDQENLFPSSRLDSRTVDFTGTTRLVDGGSNSVDLRLRLEQQTPADTRNAAEIYRAAAMTATARHGLTDRLHVRYGLHTHVGAEGIVEYAPETGATIRLGRTAFELSGIYKVPGRSPVAVFTRTARLNEASDIAGRYRYSFAVVSGSEENSITASMTVAEIDSVVRFVFDDRFSQLGDGLYAMPGDVHRDATLAMRRTFREVLVVNLVTSAGRMDDSLAGTIAAKTYFTTSLQSYFRPTGTSLDLAYRVINQPYEEQILLGSDAERLNFRIGQRVYAPLDVRVLLGFDVARGRDEELDLSGAELEKRLVGGLSFAF